MTIITEPTTSDRLAPWKRVLTFLLFVALAVELTCAANSARAQSNGVSIQPNIVIVNIDDMGWGDIGAYGSQYSNTPNIDQLATEGTRFTQFYSGAPICSPSRASLFTGQYAARSNINSFLDNSTSNLDRDNANSLSLDAPAMADAFHDAGYTTGHFGKWHLGGGRDVGYESNPTRGTNVSVPRIVEYGYDDVWTQFEGLGNRIINVVDYGGDAAGVTTRPSAYLNGLNSASEARGTGGGLDQLVYLEREYNANFMVDRAIDFIGDVQTNNPSQPFFINLWPDEVHTPHDPSPGLKAKYDNLYPNLPQESRDYLAVMEYMDQQVGRLVEYIDQQGLGSNTLILVTADNGPVDVNANNIGSAGPFRGGKGDVFEGGFREPLIARWTGHVTANRTDDDTVMWMPDLFPTLTAIAGVAPPAGAAFDGENLSDALLGVGSQTRTTSLFWDMNRGDENRHENPDPNGAGANGQEVLALRKGDWKLLINAQGTAPELYDLSADVGETNNLAFQQPTLVSQLATEALAIRYSTPSRNLPDAATPLVRLKADDLASLGNGAAVATWTDGASGDSFNGTVSQSTPAAQPTLLTGALNGRAVVSFDGDDVLASSTTNSLPSASGGVTVFAVTTADSSGQVAERLGQLGDSGGAAGEVVGFDVSSSATSTSNGGAGYRFNNGAALYDTAVADPGFHIVAWQIEPGQSYDDATLYVDGTLGANTFTGSSTNTAGSVQFTGSDLELLLGTGRGDNGALLTSDYFSGQLAEFVVYNEQLSIGQINLVANYLSTEYGLPFAYDTTLSVLAVDGLTWTGGAANFDAAWDEGNGAGGSSGTPADPFAGGGDDLYLGNNGVATFDAATDNLAGFAVRTLRIGTARGGLVVAGTEGDGTLVVTGAENLTIGNGAAPGSTDIGDMTVGEGGLNGAVFWNSTGTLKVEGRLRIGQGGTGSLTQNGGTVTAGDVAGSLKFMAIGNGAGSSGEYDLNDGQLLPGGGLAGGQLRHLRIGYAGATGVLRVGDGVGSADSAAVASPDDLYVGYGGEGLLEIKSDGAVVLQTNGAPVFIGLEAGGDGLVQQTGGRFTSDGDFSIGENVGAVGAYEIAGGSLHSAADGAGRMSVGRNGGSGRLAIGGTANVQHDGVLILADGAVGTSGRLEFYGSGATASVRQLDNAALGADETIAWTADSAGVTPLVVLGNGTNSVQLQDPIEVAANTGANGSGNLHGDGTALVLDLSALAASQQLLLVDNRTAGPIVGFFEDALTGDLYEEGEAVFGAGFPGLVTISYQGGTGNDVVLTLTAGLLGDFNGDLSVDGGDFLEWQRGYPGNQPGQLLADWQAHFGESTNAVANAARVPEPRSMICIGMGLGVIAAIRSQGRRKTRSKGWRR
ncbi:MAG: sulfatase-like hydrolase/transferase [Planctomycetales bacterium]|nr:sulfatase-like hydrolase/transferase [Planctomycetales bacterium]